MELFRLPRSSHLSLLSLTALFWNALCKVEGEAIPLLALASLHLNRLFMPPLPVAALPSGARIVRDSWLSTTRKGSITRLEDTGGERRWVRRGIGSPVLNRAGIEPLEVIHWVGLLMSLKLSLAAHISPVERSRGCRCRLDRLPAMCTLASSVHTRFVTCESLHWSVCCNLRF